MLLTTGRRLIEIIKGNFIEIENDTENIKFSGKAKSKDNKDINEIYIIPTV